MHSFNAKYCPEGVEKISGLSIDLRPGIILLYSLQHPGLETNIERDFHSHALGLIPPLLDQLLHDFDADFTYLILDVA